MPYVEISKTYDILMAVHTARNCFEGYTKQEVENSKLAREMQGIVGHSIDREYNYKVSKTLLPNFPITSHDINNTNYMF